MRPGKDATILALALMVPRALEAAEKLKAEHGIDCEVVDVRSLVPLDTQTILGSVGRTHRLFTVEENPRLCGWGAEIVSIVADEAFYDLDGPPVRITTPHIPLPAADILEDIALPTRRPHRRDACERVAARSMRNVRIMAMYDNLLANVPTDLWIGGKWRKASDGGALRRDRSGDREQDRLGRERHASTTPRPRSTPRSGAFAGWAAKKPRERAEILRKAFELIMRDAERLAKLITIENGKALSDSRGEVAYAAEFFRWNAEEAVRNHRPALRARRPPARASSCSTSRPASPCW